MESGGDLRSTGRESRYYSDLLASVVKHVLTQESGLVQVASLASSFGFSRFHFGRLFHRQTGEYLDDFIRRIRLERAAYSLRFTRRSILEIADEGGYSSGEALCRAFKGSFRMSPLAFRKQKEPHWHLPSPEGLHWNPKWQAAELAEDPKTVRARIVRRDARRFAVWRSIGNYAYLSSCWERFEAEFGAVIPRDEGRTYVTFYYDNIWTHPESDTMRSDIGWLLKREEEPPPGMRCMIVPAGLFAVTEDYVLRKDRNDAWSEMSGRYSGTVSYDEYPAWPLPFEEVLTRIVKGGLS